MASRRRRFLISCQLVSPCELQLTLYNNGPTTHQGLFQDNKLLILQEVVHTPSLSRTLVISGPTRFTHHCLFLLHLMLRFQEAWE